MPLIKPTCTSPSPPVDPPTHTQLSPWQAAHAAASRPLVSSSFSSFLNASSQPERKMLRHCLRSALTRHSPCHVSTRQLVCSSWSRYASSSSSSSPLDSSALEGVVPAHGVAPASRSDLDRRKAAFYRQLGRRGGGDLALLAKNMPPVHGREVFANSDLSLQHVRYVVPALAGVAGRCPVR